ncbi:MAG: tetratricopeptide repeat protein [Gammaproteobacteria bacterium]|nr:tetratricopeptide repeat protein [Gammaproteobacteria bacterium]
MVCSTSITVGPARRGARRGLRVRAGVGLLVLLLGGCGGLSRTQAPAQVEERSGALPAEQDSETQIAAYTPPAQPRVARPQPTRAVAVLMRRADDQRRAGDLGGAAVSLERALRISPDDAVLWHRLAAVRLSQGRYAMAVQMAAKSNTLASADDRELRGRNWRLIGDARRALGDLRGARDAERRAGAVR